MMEKENSWFHQKKGQANEKVFVVFVLPRNSIFCAFLEPRLIVFLSSNRLELQYHRTTNEVANTENKTMSLSASAVYDEAPATPEEIYLKSLTKVCTPFSSILFFFPSENMPSQIFDTSTHYSRLQMR